MKREYGTLLEITALACILVFALLLVFAFFYGPSYIDQTDNFVYSALAVHSALPNFWPQELGAFTSTKLIEIFGMRFLYSAQGISRLSESLLGVISFLLTVVIVFFIGRNLGNRRVGLLSAFFYSFMPLVVTEAAASSDDIVMALFASLSVLFLVVAFRKKLGIYYFLSGFVVWFGILSSIEEIVMLAFLVPLLTFWLWRSNEKRAQMGYTAWFVLGILIGAMLIVLISYTLSGNPMQIYRVTVQWYDISWLVRSHAPIPAFHSVANALFSPITSASSTGFGYFGYAMLFALAYLLIRRPKGFAVPVLWFAITFLYISFGTSSLTGWHFIQYRARYILIFAPAIALILGTAIGAFIADVKEKRLAQERAKKRLAVCMVFIGVLILIVSSVLRIQYNQYVNYADMYPMMNISRQLVDLPANTPIYVNLNLAYPLQFYMDYASNLEAYNNATPCGFLVGSAANLTLPNGLLLRNNISWGSLMVDSQYFVLNQSCESFSLQLDPALPVWLSKYRVDYNYSWEWAKLYKLG